MASSLSLGHLPWELLTAGGGGGRWFPMDRKSEKVSPVESKSGWMDESRDRRWEFIFSCLIWPMPWWKKTEGMKLCVAWNNVSLNFSLKRGRGRWADERGSVGKFALWIPFSMECKKLSDWDRSEEKVFIFSSLTLQWTAGSQHTNWITGEGESIRLELILGSGNSAGWVRWGIKNHA